MSTTIKDEEFNILEESETVTDPNFRTPSKSERNSQNMTCERIGLNLGSSISFADVSFNQGATSSYSQGNFGNRMLDYEIGLSTGNTVEHSYSRDSDRNRDRDRDAHPPNSEIISDEIYDGNHSFPRVPARDNNFSYETASNSPRDLFLPLAIMSFYDPTLDITETIYNLTSDEGSQSAWRDLEAVEEDAASRGGRLPRQPRYSTLLNSTGNLQWRCQVHFNSNDPMDRNYTQRFPDPIIVRGDCLFWKLFGTDRFLYVEVCGVPARSREGSRQLWAAEKLFEDGIHFAGRKYEFLGGELGKGGAATTGAGGATGSGGGTGSSENSQPPQMVLWFFATHDSYGCLSRVTVEQVRSSIGDFAGFTPSKLNARLKLGFSITSFGCHLSNGKIKITGDTEGETIASNKSKKKSILTDGCGFIGVELARRIPYAVNAGVASGPRTEAHSLPLIVQIRLSSKKGLFKGCLLVTSDESHCSPDGIAVRPSMRKSRGPTYHPNGYVQDRFPLMINSTFEHPVVIERRKASEDMYNHLDHVSVCLNRECCLLLWHLGVPANIFTGLMQMQLDKVVQASTDRAAADRLVRRGLREIPGGRGGATTTTSTTAKERVDEDDDDDDEAIDDEDDYAGSTDDEDSASSSARSTDQNQNRDYDPHQFIRVKSFLDAGHTLEEPLLQQMLRDIQERAFLRLRNCRLRLQRATYLVGAPDPTNTLEANEVFVCLPQDSCQCPPPALPSTSPPWPNPLPLPLLRGPVVVTRNPMHHPGDVRVRLAVTNPGLEQFVRGTSGGCVFFSTRGLRSAADEMGGGDYDGDTYLIIFHSEIVSKVTPVDPFEEDGTASGEIDSVSVSVDRRHSLSSAVSPAPTPRCSANEAVRSDFEMLRGLLQSVQDNLIGTYSNAWLAWADDTDPASGGPSHPSTLQCDLLVRLALDASKTGHPVPLRRDLLDKPRPHYMTCGKFQRQVHSTSIIGQLYDMVTAEMSRELPDIEVVLDLDLLVGNGLSTSRIGLRSSMLERWQRCVHEYKLELNAILSEAVDAANKNTKIERLKQRYVTQFNEDAEAIYQDDRSRIFGSYVLAGGDAGDGDGDEALRHLLEACRLLARRQLASVVYEVTYVSATNSSSVRKRKHPLSFCWDICGQELHYNKSLKMLSKSNQSPFALRPIKLIL